MLVSVNCEDVKTKFADLIEAALRGDKVFITKNGQQIVELGPIKPARKPRFILAQVAPLNQ
jgi:prevent-host-death family protein